MRSLSDRPVVSIQGQPGSFHHLVATRLFGTEVECRYRATFAEVMADAHGGGADVGVMAIENSIAGSLTYNYDLLDRYPVPIVGEVVLPIAQHLIAAPGVRETDLVEIRSHPMAIEQCRAYLNTHPEWRVVEQEDTAGSVRDLRDSGRRDVGAISSAWSATLYGMEILRPDIQTDPANFTRFWVLTHRRLPQALAHPPTRASFRFTVPNRPGALLAVLRVFEAAGVNLTKLESRPKPGSPWHYRFYCDAVCDPLAHAGLPAALAAVCEETHLLGWYPDLSG